MKKILSIALTLALLCGLLSGCMYEGFDAEIHDDGSGTVSVRAGVAEEMLEGVEDKADSKPFTVDGKTYYGVDESASFASVEEFPAVFAALAAKAGDATETSDTQAAPNADGLRLIRDGDGLTLVLDFRSTDDAEPEDTEPEEDDDDTAKRFAEYDAVEEKRAETAYQLLKEVTTGFSDAELRELADDAAETYWGDPDEDFDAWAKEIRGMSKADLALNLGDRLERLHWELTDAKRAEREAEVKKLLKASPVKLDETELDFFAQAFVDWDDSALDDEFAEHLKELRSMDEEELRFELDLLRDIYGDEEDDGASDGDDGALDLSDADLDEMLSEITLRFTFRFDRPVTQISGPADGVTVEGNTVTLELLRLGSDVYRFTTRANVPLALDKPQTVELDGKSVELRCYALRDAAGGMTNYVRVRDLAALLDGTKAQFDVGWDGAVQLSTGKPYASFPVDANGERVADTTPFSGARTYRQNAAKTNVNGAAATLDSLYLTDEEGGGYTYYKLRDLGQALGFNVRWDGARGLVCIESDKPYTG